MLMIISNTSGVSWVFFVMVKVLVFIKKSIISNYRPLYREKDWRQMFFTKNVIRLHWERYLQTEKIMKKIYLIDGNSFIYRMFFALPEFSTKDGRIVNAVFGMAKFFTGQLVQEKPDYIVFIKDAKGENFRHKIYTDYKATRERMPDNLRSQISLIEQMIGLMNVEIVEIPGYEADDVIGTLAKEL
ncbi:MAG: hypothetical protein H6767_02125 [Candidatus Peribacteria bacterium]|nr:MAG: hypothetical protein H6767_02125 [Candidatus Peribacteria bacterium]